MPHRVEVREHPPVSGPHPNYRHPRFCHRLHWVDGPQWPGADPDGGFGMYFADAAEAERFATGGGLEVVRRTLTAPEN